MILKGAQHDVTRGSIMPQARRVPITDLNEHLTCTLCKGYFIDATTIIECLHSFCRSCIVKYLETNKYCPVCDVQVHKTKPLLNIRPDKTLQDIVYKLVPKLFQNEMQRRRQFYGDHPEAKPSGLEQRGEVSYQHLLSPDETICLSFNHHGSVGTPRYLRCQAAVSISHLQKLIRAKYDLTEHHRVDVLHNQDCLNSYLTLMDVAYIYLWRRKGPLELTYRIYENTAKRLKLEVKDEPEEEIKVTTTPTATLVNNNTINNNNNDWKEVQLRISENGEMSVTGIQDCVDLLDHCEITIPPLPPQSPAKPDKPTEPSNEVESEKVEVATKETVVEEIAIETIENVKKDEVEVEVEKKTEDVQEVVKPEETNIEVKAKDEKKVEVETKKLEDVTKKLEDVTKKVEETKTKVEETKTKDNKRKLEESCESEPAVKQSKPTVLNHSLGLQNLSNNHPLKKHSQLNSAVKNYNQKSYKPSTPGPPCYVPKAATYSPVINVPVPKVQQPSTSVQSTCNNKTKPKPNAPMGYKTLRDPPKTWNPQISRTAPKAEAKAEAKPAKFFKMRNNFPRYLGNPSSGVKPMYAHASPEKEKKPEIKKHSIVKIDPKTLKPVSERAPEISSLSSGQDLKINTSSVPIFNPLKLQSSPKSSSPKNHSPKALQSPKGDRKSPQSPKKEKRISYTPPNPFIPNLPPTISPNQFMYPAPGFTSYDPRFMAAYHSLLYPRLPFNPGLTPQLNLDLNRKPKLPAKEKSLQSALDKLTQSKIKQGEDKAADKDDTIK